MSMCYIYLYVCVRDTYLPMHINAHNIFTQTLAFLFLCIPSAHRFFVLEFSLLVSVWNPRHEGEKSSLWTNNELETRGAQTKMKNHDKRMKNTLRVLFISFSIYFSTNTTIIWIFSALFREKYSDSSI